MTSKIIFYFCSTAALDRICAVRTTKLQAQAVLLTIRTQSSGFVAIDYPT